VEIYVAIGGAVLLLLVALSVALRVEPHRCPRCMCQINHLASRCPHCTSDLADGWKAGEWMQRKECRYCFEPIDRRAARCPKCHADLSRPEPAAAEEKGAS
jgi:predicted Zn-ribbon and HTH transcriptional regulator